MVQPIALMTAADIEAKTRATHDELPYRAGWRFLTCPERNLTTATLGIISLNPGGKGPRSDHDGWSVEGGNAYEIELWKKNYARGCSPLQIQVRRICALLEVDLNEVLSGYFVPFRTPPGWRDLPAHERKVLSEFGSELWRWALPQAVNLRTIICVGKDVGGTMAGLLHAHLERKVPAAWGEQTIDRYGDGSGRVLLSLPHLSTFRLFNRPESEAAFLEAIRARGLIRGANEARSSPAL